MHISYPMHNIKQLLVSFMTAIKVTISEYFLFAALQAAVGAAFVIPLIEKHY